MKSAPRNAVRNGVAGVAKVEQLLVRHVTLLSAGEFPDLRPPLLGI